MKVTPIKNTYKYTLTVTSNWLAAA